MFARFTGLDRFADLAAVLAALVIIAALAMKAPPGTPAGDWRAHIAPPCQGPACALPVRAGA